MRIATICCAVLLGWISGCERTDLVPALIARGEAAMESHDCARAIENFDEALRMNSRSREALVGRAAAYQADGDLSAAAADYARALDLEPADAQVRLRLVELHLQLAESEQAARRVEELREKLSSADYLVLQGRILIQQSNFAAARDHLNQAVAADAESAAAWYFLGVALARLNADQKAQDAFSKTLQIDSQQAKAYWQRGIVRERLGEVALAEQDRRKAGELDPRLTFADSAVGEQVLESLNNGSQSFQILDRRTP